MKKEIQFKSIIIDKTDYATLLKMYNNLGKWCEEKQKVIIKMDKRYKKLVQEVSNIAENCILPDGDGVNIPTQMWAEDAILVLKEKE